MTIKHMLLKVNAEGPVTCCFTAYVNQTESY